VAPGNNQKKLAPGLEALKAHVSTLRGALNSKRSPSRLLRKTMR
jgi:hypothetical protein